MRDISCVVDGQQRYFYCDAERHRVVATDLNGEIQWAFGGRGAGPGTFDTPLDLTMVRPEFRGERLTHHGADAAWLAVADYGNRRVQIFELDGTWVGSFDTQGTGLVGPPCLLRWSAPFLEIEGVEGACTRVHLSAILLRTRAAARSAAIHAGLTRPGFAGWDRN